MPPLANYNQPALANLRTRRNIALELALLVICTPLFLLFAPPSRGLYMGLALLFVLYVWAGRRHTANAIWGLPTLPLAERRAHCLRWLGLLTLINAAAFALWYLLNAKSGQDLHVGHLLLALGLYFPWALLQQMIFQFYLHGRLRAALPWGQPWLPMVLAGCAYGAVHYPNAQVMLLTSVAGCIWGWFYQRDRLLWPIAVSHAVLGAGFYYLVAGADMVQDLLNLR
jgi:predicted secreted protein